MVRGGETQVRTQAIQRPTAVGIFGLPVAVVHMHCHGLLEGKFGEYQNAKEKKKKKIQRHLKGHYCFKVWKTHSVSIYPFTGQEAIYDPVKGYGRL